MTGNPNFLRLLLIPSAPLKNPGNYSTTTTFKISFLHHLSRIATYIVRDTDSFTSAAVTINTGRRN
jgi:hypothetical protein